MTVRPRTWSFFAASCVVGMACNFGVNFDGIFGPPAVGPKVDASADTGPVDAAIPSVPVTQLVAGSSSICGRRLDGTVMCLSLIHISEPTRQAEISYAVFCLKKK